MNARSIASKINDLEILVSDHEPDLILVTESWCSNNISNSEISIDNYFIEPSLRLDRTDTLNGIGGGLLVYVRNGLKVLPIDNQSTFNQYCNFNVLCDNNEVDFNVTLVYRSPNSTQENNRLLNDIILNSPQNDLIVGDFNFPNIDWSTNECDARSRDFVQIIEDKFLTQLINFPTHNRGNILDIALTDCPERFLSIDNLGNVGNSDHTCILFDILSQRSKNVNESTDFIYDWSKANIQAIRDEFRNFNIESDGDTCEDYWSCFKNHISSCMDKFVPKKPRRSRNRPVWLTRRIIQLTRQKKSKFKAYCQNRSPENLSIYKRIEKNCRREVRNAKKSFERKVSKKTNEKTFNSYLKSKMKCRTGVGPLKVDNNIILNDQEIAETLNSYFSSVFNSNNGTGDMNFDDNIEHELNDIQFDIQDIKKVIYNMKLGASGPDNISVKFIKTFEQEVSGPLLKLFRKSLNSGQVPMDWKLANVTPIFKKGNKSDPSNYRPVSLTCVVCKIMESLLKIRIVNFFDQHNLLNSSQHGFLKGRSCCTNLLEFFEKVTKLFDEGKPVDIIYLDLCKAFDKVPFKRLLLSVKKLGVRGKILKWLEDWLNGRQQRVVLNGKFSDWLAVLSGIPQGSVLGPILFLIFINELDNAAILIDLISKFADDTKLCKAVQSEEDRAALQGVLDNLTEWAESTGMAFNVNKCKVLHVGNSNNKHEYKVNGSNLITVDSEKDLGVKYLNSLKPGGQCSEAARTANFVLGQICRNFHYRDKEVFLNLYKRYVRVHLEYCTPAWNPWLSKDIEILEKVQMRAVKQIQGLQATTYNARLQELNLPTLTERRHRSDMIETFKIIRGFNKVDSALWFHHINRTGLSTRNSSDPNSLVISHSRTDIRKNFFSKRVVSKWNELPQNLKNANTVNQFKSLYDKMM